jgi:outer membrane biosynthesis protein TonB
MTVTLELTEEEDAKLQAKAARAGLSPSEYLRRLIADPSDAPPYPDMAAYLRDAGVRWPRMVRN